MLKYQSRIKIYLINFFFIKFFFNLLLSKILNNKKIVNQLERNLSKLYNTNHSKFIGQCREGIYWSIKYIIDKTGKNEVILSPYTLFYVINMIINAGGKPVFVDLKYNSLEINPNLIKEKINKNTSSILLTNLSGVSSDIDYIKDLATKKGICLIEDMAVSLGSSLNDKNKYCVYGDIGILSFQAMKNIQCINGGALIYSNNDFNNWLNVNIFNLKEQSNIFLFKRLFYIFIVNFFTNTKIINFYFFKLIKFAYLENKNEILKFIRPDHEPYLEEIFPSYYFKKITLTQAKFVSNQLENLEINNEKRKKNAYIYRKTLSKIKEVTILDDQNFAYKNYLEFHILCENRDKLFFFLLSKNIDVRKFYYRNCSSLEIYRKFASKCINADNIENLIITLPCYPSYSKFNIYKIVNAITEFYEK